MEEEDPLCLRDAGNLTIVGSVDAGNLTLGTQDRDLKLCAKRSPPFFGGYKWSQAVYGDAPPRALAPGL